MITQKELHEAVHYNQDTGQFWRKYPHFSKLITTKTASGYIRFGIGYSKDYAHRWAWLYVYGSLPEFAIDHINQDRSDNKIQNLRECTAHLNAQNTKLRADNSSGHKGVCKDKHGKYLAYINYKKKRTYLCYVDTLEEAVKIRHDAELVKFQFTPLKRDTILEMA